MRGETNIYFNGQYWVGIFSREDQGRIVSVGRYIFGSEPTLALLDEWLSQGSPGLIILPVTSASQGLISERSLIKKKNPKRALREVRRANSKELSKESVAQKAVRETYEILKNESRRDNIVSFIPNFDSTECE